MVRARQGLAGRVNIKPPRVCKVKSGKRFRPADLAPCQALNEEFIKGSTKSQGALSPAKALKIF